MLLTNTQVSKLGKAFSNNSSVNIKSSNTQLHKIGYSGEFIGRLLGSLLKTESSTMKNVLKPLAKSVLIPIGLTAAASATDAGIHKNMFEPGNTTLIISNEQMYDVMKVAKSPEESGLLIKGVSETIQNEAKEQNGGFLTMWLGILGASLLGNLLIGKGTTRAGEGTIRAGEDFQWQFNL